MNTPGSSASSAACPRGASHGGGSLSTYDRRCSPTRCRQLSALRVARAGCVTGVGPPGPEADPAAAAARRCRRRPHHPPPPRAASCPYAAPRPTVDASAAAATCSRSAAKKNTTTLTLWVQKFGRGKSAFSFSFSFPFKCRMNYFGKYCRCLRTLTSLPWRPDALFDAQKLCPTRVLPRTTPINDHAFETNTVRFIPHTRT